MKETEDERFEREEAEYIAWMATFTDEERNEMDEKEILSLIEEVPVDKKGKRILTEKFNELKAQREELGEVMYGAELCLMACDLFDKLPENN